MLSGACLGDVVRLLIQLVFKFLATLPSAVYQHFFNEGSKFCSKVAAKDSQNCDSSFSIIPLHFCLLFANHFLKTLAKV